jgi:hypothetical protein
MIIVQARRKGHRLAWGSQLFVTFYVTTDLSARIISNPNQRMACATPASKSIAASNPVSNFMDHDNSDSWTMIKEKLWLHVMPQLFGEGGG